MGIEYGKLMEQMSNTGELMVKTLALLLGQMEATGGYKHKQNTHGLGF